MKIILKKKNPSRAHFYYKKLVHMIWSHIVCSKQKNKTLNKSFDFSVILFCFQTVYSVIYHELANKFDFISLDISAECTIRIKAHNERCRQQRRNDIIRARAWYKITNSTSTVPLILFKEIPWLDQSIPKIKYYYALDPFESRFQSLLNTFLFVLRDKVSPQLKKQFASAKFTTNADYVALYQAWNGALSVSCYSS